MSEKVNPEYPSSWADFVRAGRQPATAAVPEEFRELFEGSAKRVTRQTHRVPRTDRSVTDDDSATDSWLPTWVEAAPRPRRSRRPAPPRVIHAGGTELDPLTIWSPDDRKTYNDHAFPWGLVCRIETAFGERGSGVIIGPRHVLTASHCVEWSTDLAETIEVHRHGTSFRARTHATFAMAFTQVDNPTVTTLDEDYAVLVTDQRLGDAFGFLGTRLYDSGLDDDHVWDTMGYASDIGGTVLPTFQQRVALDEDEFDLGSGRAMTTTADVKKMQSGSPMFGKFGDQTQVVAVISAEGNVWFSGLENWCAGGSDLNRLVRQARTDFP